MFEARIFHQVIKLLVVATLLPLMASCFTGIESTKTITPGRADRNAIAPTPEENFLSVIPAPPLKDWMTGRKFVVADQRLGMMLESNQILPSELDLKDSILIYQGLSKRLMPDGKSQAVIKFLLPSLPDHTLLLPSGKEYEMALEQYTPLQLPMLIDTSMVESAHKILSNKHLWTLSSLWYDEKGERSQGLKFAEVTVDSVLTGNAQFPLRVKFHTKANRHAWVYMNFGSSTFDSRSFANLFSLSDVRKRYSSISDDAWNNICQGKVALGMTKEECKLSLGTPSDVNVGHTYSETLDIWQYPDGKYLRFSDGVLTDFRN